MVYNHTHVGQSTGTLCYIFLQIRQSTRLLFRPFPTKRRGLYRLLRLLYERHITNRRGNFRTRHLRLLHLSKVNTYQRHGTTMNTMDTLRTLYYHAIRLRRPSATLTYRDNRRQTKHTRHRGSNVRPTHLRLNDNVLVIRICRTRRLIIRAVNEWSLPHILLQAEFLHTSTRYPTVRILGKLSIKVHPRRRLANLNMRHHRNAGTPTFLLINGSTNLIVNVLRGIYLYGNRLRMFTNRRARIHYEANNDLRLRLPIIHLVFRYYRPLARLPMSATLTDRARTRPFNLFYQYASTRGHDYRRGTYRYHHRPFLFRSRRSSSYHHDTTRLLSWVVHVLQVGYGRLCSCPPGDPGGLI